MDPSSIYAMASLIGLKDRFAVAFASDADADSPWIVTHSQGLLPPNHYLAVGHRLLIRQPAAVAENGGRGQDLVSSSMIDRVPPG